MRYTVEVETRDGLLVVAHDVPPGKLAEVVQTLRTLRTGAPDAPAAPIILGGTVEEEEYVFPVVIEGEPVC